LVIRIRSVLKPPLRWYAILNTSIYETSPERPSGNVLKIATSPLGIGVHPLVKILPGSVAHKNSPSGLKAREP